MSDTSGGPGGPRWNQLYETAAAQDGHFTTAQAALAGYYPQLLTKYLTNGRVARVRRGVYRLVHFPPGDHEDLVVIWLWSDRAGVFSHEAALALHQLSDALPAKAHLTVPISWKSRRLVVPSGVVLHFSDLAEVERTWAGAVQVTTAARTVIDCAAAAVSPALVKQAIDEGIHRGLFTAEMIEPASEYLRSFELEDS
ncbi:MAG: type IV toxin-antitoxin system AbiEi family antitoxin domain-containing protein [Nannocystaceae bacterium]|nr:type IV toxin-antitoxin system AbiEi family antitoxin domain-containing protein [Nannocystaceae bacterium]